MNLAKLGGPTSLQVTAFKCDESDCTQAYNTSMGYFDILATDTTATIRSARALVTKRPCFWKNLRVLAESGIAVR
jgi:hypothetical protein